MNNSPELSIIIPNYNNSQYLDDCLNSIVNQTYKNFEIIICDDCSKDQSVNLIQQYAKKYPFVRIIYHKKNIGISRNRDSGILLARGYYFTVLDSDDIYYDTQKLEKEMSIVKYYKETKNQIVCAFSKIAILDKDLKYLKDQWPEKMIQEGYLFNEIITRSSMIPRDFIVATEAYFAAGKYDKTFNLYEDWDFKIRLAKKYSFYCTWIYGTGYRKHGKGLSNISYPIQIKTLKQIFKKNYHLIGSNDQEKNTGLFNLYIKSLRSFYIQSLVKEFLNNDRCNYLIPITLKIKILFNKYLLTNDQRYLIK